MKKKKETKEQKEFWAFVEKTAEEAKNMPEWKRGYAPTAKTEIVYTPVEPTTLEKWLEIK